MVATTIMYAPCRRNSSVNFRRVYRLSGGGMAAAAAAAGGGARVVFHSSGIVIVSEFFVLLRHAREFLKFNFVRRGSGA